MSGLSTFQSGPKGFKRVRNGKLSCFWPFGTLLGLSGSFGTISNKKWFFAQKYLCQTLLCTFGATNWFLSEMVQKCPDGPQKVPNCQKHLGLPFRTLLDPFGPLWNVDKPDMYGHVCFISAFCGTLCLFVSKAFSKLDFKINHFESLFNTSTDFFNRVSSTD